MDYTKDKCFFCYVYGQEINSCITINDDQVIQKYKSQVCLTCVDKGMNGIPTPFVEDMRPIDSTYSTDEINTDNVNYSSLKSVLISQLQCSKNTLCDVCENMSQSTVTLVCCSDHTNNNENLH